ncbi:MAG: hypothetical protein LUQ07_02890 [Methanospirillum sp.]|nr:hypothetical protein [Methanospirillum sp.]
MKTILVTGCVLVFLVFFCSGSAEETHQEAVLPDNTWTGTWTAENETLFIEQNGSEISGSYVPFDLDNYDTGRLEGSLSEDGKIFSGIWTDSGSMDLTLSEDMMSFSGNGLINPEGNMTEPYTYEATGTRDGEVTDTKNPWTGSWITPRKTYNLTQDGVSITGTNKPLPGSGDEPGVFEGTVQDDGKAMSVNWTETGNFVFTLSDDGTSFTGTYTYELDPSSETGYWNATKTA